MAGIYIHIPFCKKACHYCNFHFSTSLKYKTRMIECIAKELKNKNNTFSTQKVNTIYFGGGTPSLLSSNEIEYLLCVIKKNFNLNDNLEITLEANPDDISHIRVTEWVKAGINRLSIGVQSWSNDILFQLNRVHSSQQSRDAIIFAQKAGIQNLSIDLMFGLPDLSASIWTNTLQQAIDLNVKHISCYNLTLEENTALWQFVNKKAVHLPNEQNQKDQFQIAQNILSNNGYFQYEISNYALKGFESNHNSNYWNRSFYIGVGPSAHSFFGKKRKWNIANNMKYMKAIETNNSNSSQEILSPSDQFNEMIMLGLRTTQGVPKNNILKFDSMDLHDFYSNVNTLVKQKILIETKNNLSLSDKYYFLCDYYSSELFILK